MLLKKREDLSLSVFSIIAGINGSKISTKHISCECKSQFDDSKCNRNQEWNDDKCWCECKSLKKYHACEKD